jgi:hypothetical protein
MVIQAILIGVVLGLLELALLVSSKQKLGFWVYAQSVIFWFTCGFMIGIIDSPLPPYVTGAMIAVFLNLPWYINISVIPKQYGHLAPLIIASIILGIIGGIVKMWLPTLF